MYLPYNKLYLVGIHWVKTNIFLFSYATFGWQDVCVSNIVVTGHKMFLL